MEIQPDASKCLLYSEGEATVMKNCFKNFSKIADFFFE